MTKSPLTPKRGETIPPQASSPLLRELERAALPTLLFDGVCNYCNRWVNFVIRNDRRKSFRFAALQSEAGRKLIKQFNISDKEESVVLIYNGKAHIKSTACLHIFFHLGGIYSLPFAFIILPAYIRDFYYDIIAKNRYKWWGKRNCCMIPAEDVKDRFLL